MPKGKVTLVRDHERPTETNVRICKDLDVSSSDKFECFDDPAEYEKFLAEQRAENAAAAQKRGKIANKKNARETWLKERIVKAEREMKESVALVEKLRAARARQISRAKPVEEENKENVPDSEEMTSEEFPRQQRSVTFSNLPPSKNSAKPKQRYKSTILKTNRRPGKSVRGETLDDDFLCDSHFGGAEVEGRREEERDGGQLERGRWGQLERDRRGQLSRIEEEEGSRVMDDSVDHVPVRGPSRQEDELNSHRNTCLRLGDKSGKPRGPVNQPKTFDQRSEPSPVYQYEPQDKASVRSKESGRFSCPPGTRSSMPGDVEGSDSSLGIPNLPLQSSPSKSVSGSSTEDSGILSASTDLQSIAVIIQRIKQYRQGMKSKSESSVSDSKGFEPLDPSTFTTSNNSSDTTLTGGGGSSNGSAESSNDTLSTAAGDKSAGARRQQATFANTVRDQTEQLGNNLKNNNTKQFKLNKEFLQKILDFESSSPLTSYDSDSSHLKEKRHVLRRKTAKQTENRPKQKQPKCDSESSTVISRDQTGSTTSDSVNSTTHQDQETQEKLRYYIEKLLSMKHEDIADLSVSSLSTTDQTSDYSRSTSDYTRSTSEHNSGVRSDQETTLLSEYSRLAKSSLLTKDKQELQKLSDRTEKSTVDDLTSQGSGSSQSSTLKSSSSNSTGSSGKRVRFESRLLRAKSTTSMASQSHRRSCREEKSASESPLSSSLSPRESNLDETLYRSLYLESLERKQRQNHSANEEISENKEENIDEADRGYKQQKSRSSDDSLSRNSYREIQQLYKQKREELDLQLQRLGQNTAIQDVAISEGSLSTSSSTDSRTPPCTKELGSRHVEPVLPLKNDIFSKPGQDELHKSTHEAESIAALSPILPEQRRLDTDDESRATKITSRKTVLYAEEQETTTTYAKNDGKSEQERYVSLHKRVAFQERLDFESLLTDLGTDSESGSLLSHIDLTSDLSSHH